MLRESQLPHLSEEMRWRGVSEGVAALTADKSPQRRVLIEGTHSAGCGGVVFLLQGTFFSAQFVDDFVKSAGN